jgi:hypothetical protein
MMENKAVLFCVVGVGKCRGIMYEHRRLKGWKIQLFVWHSAGQVFIPDPSTAAVDNFVGNLQEMRCEPHKIKRAIRLRKL